MLTDSLAGWRTLNTYDRWYFAIAVIFTLASNVSAAITSTCMGLTFAVFIVQCVRQKRWPSCDKPMLTVIAAYIIMWTIVCLAGWEPGHGLRELWGATVRIVPLFLMLYTVQKPWQIQCLVLAFTVSVGIDIGKALWQFFTPTAHSWGIRPTGFNKSPTFLASHMLLAIPMLFFAAGRMKQPLWLRVLCLCVGAVAVAVLVITQTRGAWLSLVVVGIFCLALLKHCRRRLAQGFAVGLVLFVAATVCAPALHNRLCSLTDLSYQSNSERLLMWQSAWHIFVDYPLLGIGQDEFAVAYNTQYISPLAEERATDAQNPRSGHTHPHSNILKMLAEGGIVGLSAFLLLHGYFAYRLYRLWQAEKNAGCNWSWGLVGLLVMLGIHLEGLTDTNLTQLSITREYWLLVGFCMAAAVADPYEQR